MMGARAKMAAVVSEARSRGAARVRNEELRP
jgi:hypothetical protein